MLEDMLKKIHMLLIPCSYFTDDDFFSQPHIRIWNSVSLATVAVIGNGDFSGPINGLSFSRADGGVLLAAIEDSPDKIISVWEVRGDRGQRITETRVRTPPIPDDSRSVFTTDIFH